MKGCSTKRSVEAARALELASLPGGEFPAVLSEVRGWQGLLAAMSGRHDRARDLVEESLRLAVEHDLTEQAALAYRRRANIRDYAGRYAEVRQAHAAAIGLKLCGQPLNAAGIGT